ALVVVHGQGELLEVVGAAHPVGGLAHLLHRRQQQADQHRDDGDDDEQLDEGEGAARIQVARRHETNPPERTGSALLWMSGDTTRPRRVRRGDREKTSGHGGPWVEGNYRASPGRRAGLFETP